MVSAVSGTRTQFVPDMFDDLRSLRTVDQLL